MMKYLVVLLDDSSESYCHYDNRIAESRVIEPELLQAGITFAMKQNLIPQFVYPVHDISLKHKELVDSIDHIKIAPARSVHAVLSDVVIVTSPEELEQYKSSATKEQSFVLRVGKDDLFRIDRFSVFAGIKSLNIVITDIESFEEEDFDKYKQWLDLLSTQVSEMFLTGKTPQINILSDRILLDEMNNCNAGQENITLAPNGKLYACPAFYFDDPEESIGDIHRGLAIPNPQLYSIQYAPLCRICDAFQCKRCIWLNKKTTLEVNTPSHEQCVVAHLERNNSRRFFDLVKDAGYFVNEKPIPTIDYLDPFEVRQIF